MLETDAIGALTAVGMGQVCWLGEQLEQNHQMIECFTVQYDIKEKIIENSKQKALKSWQDCVVDYKRRRSSKG